MSKTDKEIKDEFWKAWCGKLTKNQFTDFKKELESIIEDSDSDDLNEINEFFR